MEVESPVDGELPRIILGKGARGPAGADLPGAGTNSASIDLGPAAICRANRHL